jgi:hypothetical protein
MTREEFINVLIKNRYSYREYGNRIIVNSKRSVVLGSLISMPSGVDFNNVGNVNLDSLIHLPSDVRFYNTGIVSLDSVRSISPGVYFKPNYIGDVVWIPLLGGEYFSSWKGNIKDINNFRLLNKMISLGLFER